MTDTDPDRDRLQDVLNAIPAERDGMTIAELDGYVAALIVCPDTILPSEWLPGVWGEEHEFGDVDEAEATIAAVMGHYNRIARELAEHPEDYAPVLEIDPNGGETLWEQWIDGFERAMRLRLRKATRGGVIHSTRMVGDCAGSPVTAAPQSPPHKVPQLLAHRCTPCGWPSLSPCAA